MGRWHAISVSGGRRIGAAAVPLTLAFLALFLFVGLAAAQEIRLTFVGGRATQEIDVATGHSVTVRTDQVLGELVVGNTDIADVFPLTDRSFYILGKQMGRTNIAVFDGERRLIGFVDVEVGVDAPDLAESIRQAAPGAAVQIQSVSGRLRLSGTVPDAVALRKVLEIARQYSDNVINALRVEISQQVMLEVRFIEASRGAGRELGISWFVQGNDARFRTGTFRQPTVQEAQSGIVTFTETVLSGAAPFGTLIARVLEDGINADILVQALEDKNLARTLAEPNLVAMSGQTASFHAGGEVPIPVVTGENDNVGVEFKRFGVRLAFTPVVLDDGLINLTIEPEVSEVDFSIATTVRDSIVPGISTRNANTTIELRDGQSFAIAGLLRAVNRRNQSQIPWLGQLPVIGALFRSSSFQKEETDLVIIVTPHLVKPSKPSQPLQTPHDATRPSNDTEFFLLGMQEVNKDMLKRFYYGEGVHGPYGHIIELPPEAIHAIKKK